MARSAKFDTKDFVEIVELLDEDSKAPILTIFMANRHFHKVYQHRVVSKTKKVTFTAQYVRCDNAYVAAGYELATQQYAKPGDLKKLPPALRIAVMNCLPERNPCASPATLPEKEATLTFNPPAKICDPTEISLCPVTEVDRTSTESDS